MKIRVLSDLHLEFEPWAPPKVEADIVVLAGDIHLGTQALPWIKEHFPDVPVIYIAGNHEGYHHELWEVKEKLSNADIPNLRFLNNDWTEIDGVWFFGGTLWTDYALDGNPEAAMLMAEWGMNDHRCIRYCGYKFTPSMALAQHHVARVQIEGGLDGFPGKTVIVSHHLPSRQSIDPAYTSSSLNPAYAAPSLFCQYRRNSRSSATT